MSTSLHSKTDELHFIWVIHGTFNAPKKSDKALPLKWYQLDKSDSNNFCNKLNKKLKNTSFDDAVWRSLDNSGAPDSFIWSGENEDADRNQAAKKLCDKIINLTQQVPNCRIHFIAHSHGGNVALKAIELYYKKLSEGVDLLVWYIYKNNNDTQALEEIIDQYFSQVDQESILSVIEKNQENLKKASDYNFLVKYPKLLLQGHNIRKRIKDDIKQISNINRMGEVIFLGTPFYRKQNKKIAKYRSTLNLLLMAFQYI